MAFSRKDYTRWLLLGRGGEASVYKAWQTSVGRPVAIRVLDASSRTKAESEVRLLAGLRHQGLATLLDYGYEHKRYYLVQDLVRGVAPELLVPMHPVLAVESLRSLSTTLAYLHSQGIAHNDLHPDNCMLTSPGRIVLVDFGMAGKLGQPALPGQGPTRYTSPEHAQGQPIVPASDVFACGCLLYYFLTGNHLIADSGTVKADEILLSLATDTGQRELNSRWLGLPHPLLRVLDGCLRFQAADRFADMEELDENLEIALQELNRSIEPAAHAQLIAAGHTAIRNAYCQQEQKTLATAFHSALGARNWKLCEYLVADMANMGADPDHVRRYQKSMSDRRSLVARIRWFSLALSIIVLGLFAWQLIRSQTPATDSLERLEARMLEAARDPSQTDGRMASRKTDIWRLVSIPEQYSFEQFWVNGFQQPMENGVLRLRPGHYHVVGLIQSSSEKMHGRLDIPANGPVSWHWN